MPADTFHTFVFERQDDFREIDDFVEDTNRQYDLRMRRLNTDFRNGVQSLVNETQMKAIILGTRRQVTSRLQLWSSGLEPSTLASSADVSCW